MRFHQGDQENLELNPTAIGMASIPILLIGLFFIFFSDTVIWMLKSMAYRQMNPWKGFEDSEPESDQPSRWATSVVKLLGWILFLFGGYLFFYAEEFYNYWS